MKKQIKEELKMKTKEEMIKELSDLRSELNKLSLAVSMGKETNTASLKTYKKNITRVLTLLNQPKVAVSAK